MNHDLEHATAQAGISGHENDVEGNLVPEQDSSALFRVIERELDLEANSRTLENIYE